MKSVLAQRIQAAREAAFPPINQKEVAAKLGKSPSTVSLWESGKNEPPPAEIVALSRLFKVPVGWLMGVDEENNTVHINSSQGTPVLSMTDLRDWNLGRAQERLYTEGEYPAGTSAAFKNDSSALASVIPLGAYCVVSKGDTPKNGTPVAAFVDGNFLLRRMVIDGQQTLLLADDPRFESIPLSKATDVLPIVEVIQRTRL